jgi:histidine ammonia-lyase
MDKGVSGPPPVVVEGDGRVSLEAIAAVARGVRLVRVESSPAFRKHLARSRRVLEEALAHGVPVYGANTGFGRACGNRLNGAALSELGENLIRYHGCGTGEPLGIPETRASVLCRILCFAQGYSAVTPELLEALAALLNAGVTPVVPREGSVGASGDLTPMSYIAAGLAGRREAFYDGHRMPAGEALAAAGLAPYAFQLREPLALLNGTSVMTGIAAMAVWRSRLLLEASIYATALTCHGLAGHSGHFDEAVSRSKPHAGQATIATRLRRELTASGPVPETDRPEYLQDPYSLRCAPQILGVLADAMTWIEPWLETEANSANDNPLFDPVSGKVVMGGNFYGGHVTLAMDTLKAALGSLADMADRQVALLVDPRFNRGLPADLVGAPEDKVSHHGFKGMQITASALAAQAQQRTIPIGAFSRSTESHNQDKVSLGTIAALDAEHLCTLAERVTAIHLLAAAQACRLRGDLEHRPRLYSLVRRLEALAAPLCEDRAMDQDIAVVVAVLRAGTLFGPDDDKEEKHVGALSRH